MRQQSETPHWCLLWTPCSQRKFRLSLDGLLCWSWLSKGQKTAVWGGEILSTKSGLWVDHRHQLWGQPDLPGHWSPCLGLALMGQHPSCRPDCRTGPHTLAVFCTEQAEARGIGAAPPDAPPSDCGAASALPQNPRSSHAQFYIQLFQAGFLILLVLKKIRNNNDIKNTFFFFLPVFQIGNDV